MNTSRRTFIVASVAASASLTLTPIARAVTTPSKVKQTDRKAKELGYVEIADKVDQAKNPNYSSGEQCSNCTHYQGLAGDDFGGCTLFGKKLVAAHGWCKSYSVFN